MLHSKHRYARQSELQTNRGCQWWYPDLRVIPWSFSKKLDLTSAGLSDAFLILIKCVQIPGFLLEAPLLEGVLPCVSIKCAPKDHPALQGFDLPVHESWLELQIVSDTCCSHHNILAGQWFSFILDIFFKNDPYSSDPRRPISLGHYLFTVVVCVLLHVPFNCPSGINKVIPVNQSFSPRSRNGATSFQTKDGQTVINIAVILLKPGIGILCCY